MTDPLFGKPKVTFRSLEELIEELVDHPDEAYIQDGGEQALVYDSERDAVLLLQGNFTGLPEEVAWALRKALAEQHPLPDTEEVDHAESWTQDD